MPRSKLELEFEAQLKAARHTDARLTFEREFQFCTWRKWRADFAIEPDMYEPDHPRPEEGVLVEIQGHGPQGRHGSWGHAESDAEKFSTAAALGWRVLPITGKMVRDGTGLRLVEAALGIRPLEPPAPRVRQKRLRAVKRPAKGRGLPKHVLEKLPR